MPSPINPDSGTSYTPEEFEQIVASGILDPGVAVQFDYGNFGGWGGPPIGAGPVVSPPIPSSGDTGGSSGGGGGGGFGPVLEPSSSTNPYGFGPFFGVFGRRLSRAEREARELARMARGAARGVIDAVLDRVLHGPPKPPPGTDIIPYGEVPPSPLEVIGRIVGRVVRGGAVIYGLYGNPFGIDTLYPGKYVIRDEKTGKPIPSELSGAEVELGRQNAEAKRQLDRLRKLGDVGASPPGTLPVETSVFPFSMRSMQGPPVIAEQVTIGDELQDIAVNAVRKMVGLPPGAVRTPTSPAQPAGQGFGAYDYGSVPSRSSSTSSGTSSRGTTAPRIGVGGLAGLAGLGAVFVVSRIHRSRSTIPQTGISTNAPTAPISPPLSSPAAVASFVGGSAGQSCTPRQRGPRRKCLERGPVTWRSGSRKGKSAGTKCIRYSARRT